MLAARFVKSKTPLIVMEIPDPISDDDGIVIEIETAGVCGTDAHLWAGDWDWAGIELELPITLGHEVAGRVVEVGHRVQDLKLGDRVIVPFHLSCGHCRECRSGLSNLCANAGYLGSSQDGAFAQFMAVPRASLNAVQLPDDIAFEDAAALGCRYMTAFRGIVDLGAAEAGEWMVVLGAAGGVGRAALQLAEALGVQTIAIDVPDRIDGLKQFAQHTLAIDNSDLRSSIFDITKGGAQLALDAVAKPTTTAAAVGALGKSGRLLQIGLTGPESRGSLTIPMDEVVHKEIRVFGVNGNPHTRFDPLLSLIATNRLRPSEMISRMVSLEEVSGALESMRDYANSGLTVARPNFAKAS